jgi:hypothetical protein
MTPVNREQSQKQMRRREIAFSNVKEADRIAKVSPLDTTDSRFSSANPQRLDLDRKTSDMIAGRHPIKPAMGQLIIVREMCGISFAMALATD